MDLFKPSREDGRSDKRVVYDTVTGAEPGTLFSHAALIKALSEGLDEIVDVRRVYPAVAQANRMLLREDKRYLQVVRGDGYRILAASEHLPVAIGKKEKAQTLLKRGVDILQNVRLEEMEEPQRSLHQGQLILMAGLYQHAQESDKRMKRQDKAIDELRGRVDKLETI